jgi:hypothetical protein
LVLQHAFGAGWYYAPGRWPTADGIVPYRIVWPTFAAMQGLKTMDALATAHGIGLAFAGEDQSRRLFERAIDEAYPPLMLSRVTRADG